MIKNLLLFLSFFGSISVFFGFHFLVENPMQEGNILGILLMLGTFFSGCLVFFFPEKKTSQENFLAVSVLISVCIAFSFVFIDNAHNDYYRYLWDGKASEISHETGKNVYEVIPWNTYEFFQDADNISDEEKNDQKILFERTGFKQYYTTYPPTLQLVFWANAKIHSSFVFENFPKISQERILKFLFFLFYLGIIFLIYKIFWKNLRYRKFVPTVILSPLLLWEGIAAGHSEIVFVFFLLLSIFCMQQKKYFFSGASLSALVWVKYFPAILGFIFLWEIWRKPSQEKPDGRPQGVAPTKNILMFMLGGILSTVCLWIPFFPFDPDHFIDAMKLYGREWRMFPLFFDLIENDFSLLTAQITQISLVLGVMIFGVWKKFSLEKNIFWIFFIYLLFSPAIFSWYFLWVFPLGFFVLGGEKKYVLLGALLFTPLFQHFYTIFDSVENIFYYESNGLELSQKMCFWGVLIVALVTTFFLSLWKKSEKSVQ